MKRAVRRLRIWSLRTRVAPFEDVIAWIVITQAVVSLFGGTSIR